jgi:proline iminopeptidase
MLRSLVLLGLSLSAIDSASAQSTPPIKPATRADATAIIAEARRIVAPGGIESLEKVRIGGIDQFVSVRGVDRRNPVLLYIHGGPGYPSIPMSWWTAQGWPEYFTVVQWDQRSTGKTHLLTDPAAVAPTLTNERMVADAEEMAQWARKTFGKRKIFVLGHSYGSYIGLELAQRHPDWLHAYIGVAQVTDLLESERRGWRYALDAAQREGNAEAISALQSIAPYAAPGKPPSIEQLYVERKWMTYFGGAMAYRRNYDADQDLSNLSPDYTDREIAHQWDGNVFSTPYLFPELLHRDHIAPKTLAVPLILFEGRHDKNVNADVAAEWFDRVKAPEKHVVWFEHSGHMIMTEEPGKALVSLVRYARPLAERAGDVAP